MQSTLVVLALVTVPILLLGTPLFLYRRHRHQARKLTGEGLEDRTRLLDASDCDEEQAGSPGDPEEEEVTMMPSEGQL